MYISFLVLPKYTHGKNIIPILRKVNLKMGQLNNAPPNKPCISSRPGIFKKIFIKNTDNVQYYISFRSIPYFFNIYLPNKKEP